MFASTAMENDKKRLRNQFTRDERARLVAIVGMYASLLDRNVSIVGRKEIWDAIEKEFNEGASSSKTSAQLKKYWQNYKYHCKRTAISKDSPMSVDEGCKEQVQREMKSHGEGGPHLEENPENCKADPGKGNVVVSGLSGDSVTVSVFRHEKRDLRGPSSLGPLAESSRKRKCDQENRKQRGQLAGTEEVPDNGKTEREENAENSGQEKTDKIPEKEKRDAGCFQMNPEVDHGSIDPRSSGLGKTSTDPRINDRARSKAKFELDHQLMLRRLETEERRLRVKVAEMAVQEIRLRIRNLQEERRRAEELHQRRLSRTIGVSSFLTPDEREDWEKEKSEIGCCKSFY
ncbi:uncharacterized protein LOC105699034 [Orussus abietinus]|uniref:uncharacterized protein LOC105699034 n=1 Tax=Orussus abietinus TaxID=222816 RepID=UPI00062621D5|nr:uncharacterized protein LOC105699034 [Orussus abietinus]